MSPLENRNINNKRARENLRVNYSIRFALTFAGRTQHCALSLLLAAGRKCSNLSVVEQRMFARRSKTCGRKQAVSRTERQT